MAEVWMFTCWACDEEQEPSSTESERDRKAREAGWGMCLDQMGQAHFVCGGCLPTSLNPVRFPLQSDAEVKHG